MKPEKFLRGLDPARDAEEDARRAEEHKENRETEKARVAEILEMALRDPAHYEIRKEHDGMISAFQKTENGEERFFLISPSEYKNKRHVPGRNYS